MSDPAVLDVAPAHQPWDVAKTPETSAAPGRPGPGTADISE